MDAKLQTSVYHYERFGDDSDFLKSVTIPIGFGRRKDSYKAFWRSRKELGGV